MTISTGALRNRVHNYRADHGDSGILVCRRNPQISLPGIPRPFSLHYSKPCLDATRSVVTSHTFLFFPDTFGRSPQLIRLGDICAYCSTGKLPLLPKRCYIRAPKNPVLTRRDFLIRLGQAGGYGVAFVAMNAFGLRPTPSPVAGQVVRFWNPTAGFISPGIIPVIY